MRISNEIKAGLVVALAILIGFLFFVKTVTFRTGTYNIKTFFMYAGNLKTDAIVKLSGVEVGRLKKMNFVYKPGTKVECLLELNRNARVRSDSIAYIDTAGFVGDAFIGITPGVTEEFVKPGSVITSEDPVQMRLLMKKADDIADNLDKILVDVKTMVSDNKENVNNIVGNLEATTENFKEFSEDVKKHPWKLLFKGD
ncbi:MAG: MlaD family protein [Candidatus Omnitrophota bacterium]|nr:MlaD family protein [Candidatus Omnitrophota bacterium]